MYKNNEMIIAKNEKGFVKLNSSMLNRHGLITGASGSGKTVTLKVIAETLSEAGIPSVAMDVKGDLSGCAKIGEMNENVSKRIAKMELTDFNLKRYPVRFWDVFGQKGHPVRITVSDLGPALLSRVLNLSEAGESILNVAFKVADDEGLELLDIKDLKSILNYVSDNAKELENEYGNINNTSVSTIIRKIVAIETDNNVSIFGEPNLDINDLMKVSEESGSGFINILECEELIKNPTMYATLLVWLLSSFYEKMDEVGDLEKPKVVLFLDEAHLIFKEMNSDIIKKIVQIIKLIRSKGVSVFFISQSPTDIPDDILAQLGNRVQHCLRAYTPAELKTVKTVASTFRQNPELDTEQSILELGTGEALISIVDIEGLPTMVEKAKILPPQSYMGEISEEEMNTVIKNSIMETKYRNSKDAHSAYEKIEEINKVKEEEQNKIKEAEKKQKEEELKKKEAEKKAKEEEKKRKNNPFNKAVTKATNSTLNSIGRHIGNAIVRGILGTKR